MAKLLSPVSPMETNDSGMEGNDNILSELKLYDVEKDNTSECM